MKQKTRAELAYHYDYTCVETFKRHLERDKIVLPASRLLCTRDLIPIYAGGIQIIFLKKKLKPFILAY